MLDAVVSFLWVDAAGNEVLLDGDGSQPGSFAAGFRPFRFLDGWGMCTPTSDADFVGMCRAFGVDGYDDPRVASPTLRHRNRDVTGALMDQCHAAGREADDRRGDRPHGRGEGAVRRRPVARRARRRPARQGGRDARRRRAPGRRSHPPAAPRRAVRRHTGRGRRPCPDPRRHTDAVLAELGVNPTDIARLRAESIVA